MAGRRIDIRGTVQGVGFRPWVYRTARELGLGGRVRNQPNGVTIEAFGHDDDLEGFVHRLRTAAPPPAHVRELSTVEIPTEPATELVIVPSADDGTRALSIPPDLATCPACEAEVLDPGDRRYGYAFANCTQCGPRFTIATGVPYDRPATTMAAFALCDDCRREYNSVADRRFHAQPNACPTCGPRLSVLDSAGAAESTPDPLAAAAARLRAGDIVAVKGLGGFHLVCDAGNADSVTRLRARKRRGDKPFAVMVRDVATADAVAALTVADRALLLSAERPIVLVASRNHHHICRQVAPDTDLVGIMVPYTPLHHLLARAVGRPLVVTSGNASNEPICCTTADAVDRLGPIADALLVHDRPIANRCDDSVARVIGGAPTVLRRSRGFVPQPIQLAHAVASPVLAVGAHLSNTFCIAVGDLAYLGPHVGDLETIGAVDALAESIDRMCQLLRVTPEVVAHDLHPDYASTRLARELPAAATIGVQHHHAHVASAMAEHHLAGPVIGVAYDGTGYGTDGTSWGGEVVRATVDRFDRLAAFRPIPLPGGDAAVREVWRIAVALVDDAFDGAPPPGALASLGAVSPRTMAGVRGMLAGDINCPRARGVGRYFDGIGALCLGRTHARFESQVAVAWDRAATGTGAPYPYVIDRTATPWAIDVRPMVRAVVGELSRGRAAGELSARFHATIAAATAEVVATEPPATVVLTGGVFANARLAEGVIATLADRDVRLHRQVPPGDGGIALGQAVVADAIWRHTFAKEATNVSRSSR